MAFFRYVTLLIFILAAPAIASDGQFWVVRVVDGDTLRVNVDQKIEKFRLYGIDSPEIGQEYGTEARSVARKLIEGQKVTVESIESDHFGRDVAIVRLPDGRSLNAEMVRQGYAWWSRRHAPDDLELAEAEREARAHRRGLWRQPEPIPPWVWRAAASESLE